MFKLRFLLSCLMFLSLLLSACSTANETPEPMMEKTAAPDSIMDATPASTEMMAHETTTADGMMQDATAMPDAMMESPAWFSATLVDANTGNPFTIDDFKGKVVLVETMAVWCPTCKRQQEEIKKLHEQLGMSDDFVSISLDIDPNEDLDIVKSHLDSTGFDWRFAVVPAEVSREIAALYGDQFLNPPSAPILIIDRHGVAHPLAFGLKRADQLLESVNMYLKEEM